MSGGAALVAVGESIGGRGGVMGRPSVDQPLTPAERARRYREAKSSGVTKSPVSVTKSPVSVTKSRFPRHEKSPLKSVKPSAASVSELYLVEKETAAGRYGSVTRTETLINEQKKQIPALLDLSCPIGLDVFCDWLTIYQDHELLDENGEHVTLPVLNDGYVVRFEPDAFVSRGTIDSTTGEYAFAPMFDAAKAEYTVSRRIEHEGSYETKVSVRCDGRRVELSGNVGRFGRTDNLFGHPVLETVEIANKILSSLGLPPFTCCDKSTPLARTDSFYQRNAVITRVDLTANFAAGSRDAAFRVLHWMSGQGSARNSGKNPRNYGNGITWNEGSKRHYEKLYFKADELGKFVSEDVKQYCEQNGILRYEVSLKARELADRGLQSLVGWAYVSKEGMRMENVVYGKFAEVLTRNQVTVTEIHDIGGKLGLIARSYLNGENPYESAHAGCSTRRRWRSELMKHGLDIAQPIDVTRLTTRIRVIDLKPCSAPDWYQRTAA